MTSRSDSSTSKITAETRISITKKLLKYESYLNTKPYFYEDANVCLNKYKQYVVYYSLQRKPLIIPLNFPYKIHNS